MGVAFSHPIDRDDGHGWRQQVGDQPAPVPRPSSMFTRLLMRRWDVQPRTGRASSTVPEGQWYRGVLFRGPTIPLTLPAYQYMIDPTWTPEALNEGPARVL